MKNRTLYLLMVTFAMIQSLAYAQFKEGDSFVDGSFYTNLVDVKTKSADAQFNIYGHNINISLGKFRSNKFATGWVLSHNLATQKVSSNGYEPKRLRDLGFRISRFWEFHKPLNDKFSLYARPTAGVGYALGNSFETGTDGTVMTETRAHTISLSAGVSAGIAWRIAPKWAIYGGFAFASPLEISFGFAQKQYVSTPRPDGKYPQVNSRVLSYDFSPEISSGSIGLGFRYFY